MDLKKAYDSIWKFGLFDVLEKKGLNGKMLDLIKDTNRKTKCAVKYDGKITEFFKFGKGVRQGCPLSPLLFNIYVNDIFEAINEVYTPPVEVNENNPTNVLMYADDLILLAHSEKELQKKLDILTLKAPPVQGKWSRDCQNQL